MKTIHLFVDFEFTSLSPDAQPISMGIVSGNANEHKYPVGVVGWDKMSAMAVASERGLHFTNKEECVLLYRPEHFCSWVFSEIVLPEQVGKVEGYELSPEMNEAYEKALKTQVVKSEKSESKSFYSEFNDFDINRCDEWVRENVVGKLKMFDGATCIGMDKSDALKILNRGIACISGDNSDLNVVGDQHHIKIKLKEWLAQFSDYQITFVVDCGTWDWYHLIQLLDERERLPCQLIIDEAKIPNDTTLEELIKAYQKQPLVIMKSLPEAQVVSWYQLGLPILPSNISPVPMDLNDLIAHKKGISVREAFELDRELMGLGFHESNVEKSMKTIGSILPKISDNKHNALWDAKVMKAIYEKLSV